MGAVRMNITLPEDVVRILKKKTRAGGKSAFIAEAIRSYAQQESQEELVKRMIEGYQAESLQDEEQDWLNADMGEDT